jgi:hypothetical protein
MLSGAILSFVIPALALCQSKEMNTDELSRRAEVVAVGKVKATKSSWENNKSRIVTYVTVNVDEYLKGGDGNVITILTPGGEVDGIGELYTHTAKFEKDEDVVVFAEKDKQGRYTVSGGHDGKFRVTKDEATGTQFVANRKGLEDFKMEVKTALKVQPTKQ